MVAPAEHDGRRLPVGPEMPAVAYVVEGSSRVAFFGDTDLFDGMGGLFGDLDVALLPIWGWGPRVGPGHLDPERSRASHRAARAAHRGADHWETLAGPRVWWRADPAEPARRFAQLVAAHAPDITVRVLAPGERLALPGGGAPRL